MIYLFLFVYLFIYNLFYFFSFFIFLFKLNCVYFFTYCLIIVFRRHSVISIYNISEYHKYHKEWAFCTFGHSLVPWYIQTKLPLVYCISYIRIFGSFPCYSTIFLCTFGPSVLPWHMQTYISYMFIVDSDLRNVTTVYKCSLFKSSLSDLRCFPDT